MRPRRSSGHREDGALLGVEVHPDRGIAPATDAQTFVQCNYLDSRFGKGERQNPSDQNRAEGADGDGAAVSDAAAWPRNGPS